MLDESRSYRNVVQFKDLYGNIRYGIRWRFQGKEFKTQQRGFGHYDLAVQAAYFIDYARQTLRVGGQKYNFGFADERLDKEQVRAQFRQALQNLPLPDQSNDIPEEDRVKELMQEAEMDAAQLCALVRTWMSSAAGLRASQVATTSAPEESQPEPQAASQTASEPGGGATAQASSETGGSWMGDDESDDEQQDSKRTHAAGADAATVRAGPERSAGRCVGVLEQLQLQPSTSAAEPAAAPAQCAPHDSGRARPTVAPEAAGCYPVGKRPAGGQVEHGAGVKRNKVVVLPAATMPLWAPGRAPAGTQLGLEPGLVPRHLRQPINQPQQAAAAAAAAQLQPALLAVEPLTGHWPGPHPSSQHTQAQAPLPAPTLQAIHHPAGASPPRDPRRLQPTSSSIAPATASSAPHVGQPDAVSHAAAQQLPLGSTGAAAHTAAQQLPLGSTGAAAHTAAQQLPLGSTGAAAHTAAQQLPLGSTGAAAHTAAQQLPLGSTGAAAHTAAQQLPLGSNGAAAHTAAHRWPLGSTSTVAGKPQPLCRPLPVQDPVRLDTDMADALYVPREDARILADIQFCLERCHGWQVQALEGALVVVLQPAGGWLLRPVRRALRVEGHGVLLEVEGEGLVGLERLSDLPHSTQVEGEACMEPHLAHLCQELCWRWCSRAMPVHTSRQQAATSFQRLLACGAMALSAADPTLLQLLAASGLPLPAVQGDAIKQVDVMQALLHHEAPLQAAGHQLLRDLATAMLQQYEAAMTPDQIADVVEQLNCDTHMDGSWCAEQARLWQQHLAREGRSAPAPYTPPAGTPTCAAGTSAQPLPGLPTPPGVPVKIEVSQAVSQPSLGLPGAAVPSIHPPRPTPIQPNPSLCKLEPPAAISWVNAAAALSHCQHAGALQMHPHHSNPVPLVRPASSAALSASSSADVQATLAVQPGSRAAAVVEHVEAGGCEQPVQHDDVGSVACGSDVVQAPAVPSANMSLCASDLHGMVSTAASQWTDDGADSSMEGHGAGAVLQPHPRKSTSQAHRRQLESWLRRALLKLGAGAYVRVSALLSRLRSECEADRGTLLGMVPPALLPLAHNADTIAKLAAWMHHRGPGVFRMCSSSQLADHWVCLANSNWGGQVGDVGTSASSTSPLVQRVCALVPAGTHISVAMLRALHRDRYHVDFASSSKEATQQLAALLPDVFVATDKDVYVRLTRAALEHWRRAPLCRLYWMPESQQDVCHEAYTCAGVHRQRIAVEEYLHKHMMCPWDEIDQGDKGQPRCIH